MAIKYSITDDPSVQKNGSTLRRDSSFILNRVNAGIDYIFNRRSYVGISVNHMIKVYDDSERQDESNEDSVGVAASGWRQFSRSMGMLGEIMFYNQGYEDYLGVDRGFSAVRGTVGLRKNFSSHLNAEGRVGFSSLGYSDDSFDNDAGPYLSGLVRYSPTPKTIVLGSLSYALKKSDVHVA